MKRLLPFLFLPVLALAAPSTPITRGRLTTDLDAAGHSITNGPMATTNFMWEVVGAVTNNFPQAVTNIVEGVVTKGYVEDLGISAGLATNDVQAIIASTGVITTNAAGVVEGILSADALTIAGGALYTDSSTIFYGDTEQTCGPQYELAVKGDLDAVDIRTNLPPLSLSATVGDLVDAVNAIANALRKEEP